MGGRRETGGAGGRRGERERERGRRGGGEREKYADQQRRQDDKRQVPERNSLLVRSGIWHRLKSQRWMRCVPGTMLLATACSPELMNTPATSTINGKLSCSP